MKYQRALALACLAKIYLEGGDGVEKDFSLAVKYVEEAVELDSNVGRATLGFMHMHGYGVDKDLKKAQQLFELSNKHGWFESAVFLGEMYYHNQISAPNGRNYQKALQFFGIAAQQRNLVAMYYMGEMHSKSLGASRSCQTAVGYFKEVVEQGSKDNIDIWKRAFEAFKLGDYKKAFVNYNFLADLGYEIAQANVAQMIHDKNIYDLSDLFDRESRKNREKFNWQRAADQTGSTAKQATLQL